MGRLTIAIHDSSLTLTSRGYAYFFWGGELLVKIFEKSAINNHEFFIKFTEFKNIYYIKTVGRSTIADCDPRRLIFPGDFRLIKLGLVESQVTLNLGKWGKVSIFSLASLLGVDAYKRKQNRQN